MNGNCKPFFSNLHGYCTLETGPHPKMERDTSVNLTIANK